MTDRRRTEKRRLGRSESKDPSRPTRTVALAVSLFLSTALAACSPPQASEHAGHGTVVEVDRSAHTITLDHEDIPGLMMGMTMTFAVAPEVDLGAIEPAAIVDFRVKSVGSEVTVIAIGPAAP